MNLFYLVANKNKRFARSRNVAKFRVEQNGSTWRGVKIDQAGGSLFIEKITECRPFLNRPSLVGWHARAIGLDTEVAVRFMSGGKTVGKRRFNLAGRGFEPLILPWPTEPFEGELDLEIYCSGPAPVFIASHFDLDRDAMISRCKGRGVELGPGPNPHIRPSKTTEILYIEQKTPDEWVSLYGDHYKMNFDPALKPNYVVGEAHNIPAEKASLDFIYSSHVFEHLVNPIGHLEIWSALLRPDGEVVMVVPDYIGSKDFLAEPTQMNELLAEYERGTFDPEFNHYQRYAAARSSPDKAGKLFDTKSSIHMHYYSNDNVRDLLDYAVKQGYFRRFTILHTPNAKDFHVILLK